VGTSSSRDFPTTAGTVKPVMLPRSDAPNSYWYDAIVTKVNPAGTALIYSTYFGGREGSETGSGVAVDANGNVVITGTTMASDFPTVNAYQATFGGTDDAFAAKLNSTGSAVVFSTFLGGNNTDLGGRIALNQTTGEAVFAGSSISPNFPTTPGAYKPQLCNTPQGCSGIFYSGSYLVKLAANGNAVYSTLFDAAVSDVTLDVNDNATFGGSLSITNFPATPGAFQTTSSGGIEGFIAKLNPTGNTLVYGTYLGGGLQSDRVKSIAVDSVQNITVTGQTQNTGFPTTAGAFDQTFNGGEDGFVTKLDPTGSALVYSTFLGGTGRDEPFAIGIGSDDSVFVAGETTSGANFPLRNSINGIAGTIFMTHLSTDASALVYSTLLGQGGAYDLAVDASNNAYITGQTTSIPVTPDAFQIIRGGNDSSSSAKDAFVMKIGAADENATYYSISGTVTDQNFGFSNNYAPILVTVTGTVNRSYNLPYSGNGVSAFFIGNLPSGGNYSITARKVGFEITPQSVVFNNLGANQSADFTILRNQAPQATITSPAHGTTFNAPASFTIRATATDPDGDAIQRVVFVAYTSATGTNAILGTDTTAPFEFTWTNVPIGTYALYAIPYDSHGLLGQTQNTVHVFVIDPATPSVTITSPVEGQIFEEGDNIPLSANVSSSITVLEFYDQSNTIIGRRITAPWSTTWRAMTAGNYTITAKGYTSQGVTVNAPNPVHITVSPINHRVSGRIVENFTNNPLSGVTLNLTCPSNPNITAQTTTDAGGNYLFTNLGTTPDDGIVITPTLAGYSFVPPNRATGYLGYIKDWLNQNFNAVRQTQISVTLTSPANGEIYTAPATVNLAASASSGAGTVTKVDFYASGILVGTDTTAPFEFQWTNVAANYLYQLHARATDSTGAIQDSEHVSITVNAPPTAVSLHGFVYNSGGGYMQGITLRMTGTANGNQINQTAISNYFGAYGFFNLPVGGNYTITPEAPNTTFTPPSATFTNVTADILDIDFTASATNQAPTVQINSPANGAVYSMPVAIPINVTSSDIDGQVVRLTIAAQSPTFVITIGESNSGTFNAPWQPNLPGNYTLWAIARDNGGLQTSASIQITVNPPLPVSIAGRIVDRSSTGIDGVSVILRDLQETTVIASATTDANGSYSIPNIPTFANYVLRASKPDYSFSPQRRFYYNLSTNQPGDFTGTLQVQRSEFDGDGMTDLAVWRPSSGVWYVDRSSDGGSNALQFGGAVFGDVAVPGNFDGDMKTDYAVFRHGTWYIRNSSNASVRIVQFGIAGDKPLSGDFDGDGMTDVAVWRPSTGVWHILRSGDGGYGAQQFGLPGDVPMAGDFDGDGKSDFTIWRPSTGVWYIQQSSDGGYRTQQFGLTGDLPSVGDFDGDKLADIVIFRPSSGVWYVNLSGSNGYLICQWGMAGDIPVTGDYDRDGKADLAVFRPSEGNWYVLKSSNDGYTIRHFGLEGDIPVPAAY
jgi:hypothetical protein